MIPALIAAGASLAGGALSAFTGAKNAKKQAAMQQQFAKNAIQWKVKDALKAGVHPLYALGANTVSYQPTSVGGSDYGVGEAGRQIAAGIASQDQPGGRAQDLAIAAQEAQIEGLRLDNEIKKADLGSKLGTVNPAGSPIPFYAHYLMDGQGNSNPVPPGMDPNNIKYQTRTDVADPASPAYVYGASPSVRLARTSTGGWEPVIPPELAESLESDRLGELIWMIRNRVLPSVTLGQYGAQPNIPREPYEGLYYNPFFQEWQKTRRGIPNFRRF